MSAAPAAVVASGVTRRFGRGKQSVLALDTLDLTVRPGEFVAIVGASGCGKSTLLNLLAGLDTPSAGSIEVAGQPSLMFQEAALFPWLTVRKNVELPMKLAGVFMAY